MSKYEFQKCFEQLAVGMLWDKCVGAEEEYFEEK